ncbi:MAG: VOC family protein, partial [Woeseiaceae bacterium]
MQSIKLFGYVATLLLLLADTTCAQLDVAGEGRVVYGHHHFNVSNVKEQRRFWDDTLGGTAASFGEFEIIKFTNVILFMREKTPAGGSKGSTVNHIGFTVPDLEKVLDRIEAAGFSVVTKEEVPATMQVKDGIAYNEVQDAYLAFVMAPDDIKIEFIGAPQQAEVAKLHHIHFATPDITAMQAWYASTLGAVPGMRGNFEAADLPGVNLTFSRSDLPLSAT